MSMSPDRKVSEKVLAVMAAGGMYVEAWPLGRASLVLSDGRNTRLFFDEAHVCEHHAIAAREPTPEGRTMAERLYVRSRIDKALESA